MITNKELEVLQTLCKLNLENEETQKSLSEFVSLVEGIKELHDIKTLEIFISPLFEEIDSHNISLLREDIAEERHINNLTYTSPKIL